MYFSFTSLPKKIICTKSFHTSNCDFLLRVCVVPINIFFYSQTWREHKWKTCFLVTLFCITFITKILIKKTGNLSEHYFSTYKLVFFFPHLHSSKHYTLKFLLIFFLSLLQRNIIIKTPMKPECAFLPYVNQSSYALNIYTHHNKT